MPRQPVKPFKKNSSNVDVLNAIRKHAGTDYQRRVPEVTKANVRETIDNLWNGKNFGARNEAVDTLVNVLGMMITRYNSYTNPYAIFKRPMLTHGDSIEEIQVGLVQSYAYDPDRDELERAVFGQAGANVQASIHKVNRQEYYKITINEDMLQRAFYKDGGLAEFISQLMDSPSTSDNLDEQNLMLSLFNEYYRSEGFFNVNVPDVSAITSGEADAKALLRAIRATAGNLEFHTPYYNAAGMHTHATADKLVLFITPEAKAAIDVEALAALFHMDKADIPFRVMTVPKESMPGTGTQALLTTEDFFVVADTLYETRSIQNPAGLYNNYFLHHHQILSVSRFVPAVRFSLDPTTEIVVDDPAVVSVPVPTLNVLDQFGTPTPESSATRGEVYQVFNTAVTSDPESGLSDGVRLELFGNESSLTRLTNTGTLRIGLDEPATKVRVKATALADESKTNELEIPIVGDMATLWPNPGVSDAPAAASEPDEG